MTAPVPPTSSVPPTPPTPHAVPPTPQSQPQQPRSSAGRITLIVTAIVGGVALLTAGVSATAGVIAARSYEAVESFIGDDGLGGAPTDGSGLGSDSWFGDSVDVTGLTGMEIRSAAASFDLVIGEGDLAEIEVTGERSAEWRISTDGSELVVSGPEPRILSGCIGCVNPSVALDRVTLTLPASFAERGDVAAEITVEAGTFRGAGSFRTLDLDVEAGELNFTGTAHTLELDVEAGQATVELTDAARVETSLDVGKASLTLAGKAPESLDLSATMGSINVVLPQETYRLDQRSEFGSVSSTLDEDEKSPRRITARAEAAEITLRPGE